jgi:hypothetical protein
MNRTERRSWDRYVAEAREVRSEVDLPNGEVLTIYIPSAEQAERLQKAGRESGIWEQLDALLGTENVIKLRAVAEDAPITALNNLMEDVLTDLGLRDAVEDLGNSVASSS